MRQKLMAALEQGYEEAVGWRRYLHQHPELSFQEQQTAAFVAERLRGFGLEVTTNVGGNGVIGLLRGALPGPTVALRADIDALPIQDEKSCEYASEVPGVMHACGHDGHTSALLMAAKAMTGLREQLSGTIKFIFQHAEEMTPGGAHSIIQAGALDDVDVIYGVHLWTPCPAGHVYGTAGAFMASADEFVIHITGKGGHGGLPHQAIDTVVIGSHLVVNLQSIVSRSVDPLAPCVVTVGSLSAGTAFNVIAEKCVLKGTVRAFNEETRMLARQQIIDIAQQTCTMFGATADVQYMLGYPPVVNDAGEIERFHAVAEQWFGTEQVHSLTPLMAAEDYSFYLQQKPGCFMFVGAGDQERGFSYSHHHPKFDFDERAMLQSAQLLLGMALDYISEHTAN